MKGIAPGVWECGGCEQPTAESHWYTDAATGTQAHAPDGARAREWAAQCGWQFYDGYEAPYRCQLDSGHGGLHRSSRARWGEDGHDGAIPPSRRDFSVRHDYGEPT